jgi:hypothetical protein
MKKILSILVIGLFVLSGVGAIATPIEQNQKNMTATINISKPIFNEKQDYIEINLLESDSNLIQSGKPLLPKITKVYTLPFGTKITDVKVTFSEEIQETVTKLVEPSPEALIVSSVYKSKTNNGKIVNYDDIKTYPETRYSFRTGAGLQNSEHVIFLAVNIYPVQYTPSTNTVIYSKTATIDIDYSVPANPIKFGNEYNFLIITPSQFKDELQPLVDYKNGDGTSTMIVTLDEIPDTGVDKQESIKYYVKYAIETWGITYLLLVGAGVEDSELFPVRNAYIPSGNYEQYFPSDLYYADIYDSNGDFSTWDNDGDGKYAEVIGLSNDIPAMDMYPDVYLGKLPCNNEAEVTTIVDKIINYEEHNKMLNKIVQLGGDTFSPIDGDKSGINEGEYVNSEVIKKLPGYESIKLWGSNNELTKNNIASEFKNGADFFDFSGHGSWASWATHPPGLDPDGDAVWIPAKTVVPPSPYTGWLYVDFDIFMLNNGYKLPVVILNACSCNKYSESPTCVGYKVLSKENGGGIASYAASGIGYGSYGTDESERLWGWMEIHIFEGLYKNKILGVVWANAINGYINSFIDDEYWDDADYKTIVEMAMFGDPTLAIEDGKDPKSHSIDYKLENYPLLEKIMDKLPRLQTLLKIFTKIKSI